MIVYDKEQKQIVIPNGLGNVNIIINQGCDDDKPVPPQDGWGMTGIFNNWGESPDIPFEEDGEWDGRPYKVIRNFEATGGEFKIRRNNAWTDSYTASFYNIPQFAQLQKFDWNMSINDGVWDIYLFFRDDGEPNEMLILHPGTDLSTIQYEYTLTISTDKENAIIEIADAYRGMNDRYYGGVTVTMKYGCIYYINIYMEGYEDIYEEITCYNDEERNYTLTKSECGSCNLEDKWVTPSMGDRDGNNLIVVEESEGYNGLSRVVIDPQTIYNEGVEAGRAEGGEGGSCNLGVLDWTLDSPYGSQKNASDDGYNGYEAVVVRPENIIAQEKENAINDFKNKMKEITITENGTYSIDDQEARQYIEFDGNSYFDSNIPFGENTKIEVAITKTTYEEDEQIIGCAHYDLINDSHSYDAFGIVVGAGLVYGVLGNTKTNNIPFSYEEEQILTLDRNGIHSSFNNDTGGWIDNSKLDASSIYGTTIGIGKIKSVGDGWIYRGLKGRIRYVKIWANKDDNSTMTLFRPKNMTQGAFGVVNSEGIETGQIENLGSGTATFVEENVKKYPNGFKRVEVNVPYLNGSYDEGYAQGQADVAANARVLDVTENGVYRSKYSDSIIPDTYTVTGIYDDGTKFHNYAELNGKVFNTKIAGSVDSRLEFWYKGDNQKSGDAWNVIIGSGDNDDSNCFQVRYFITYNNSLGIEVGDSTRIVNNWDDTVWHHLIISKAEGLWIDGEKKGDFSPSNTINGEFFINGIGYSNNGVGDGLRTANGTFGMIKIDDVVIIPTADGFLNTNTGELLEVVKDGTYTFTENLPIYGEGELYKTINVNVAPKINIQKTGLKLGYSTFTKVPDWVDFKGVTNMGGMFYNCSNLQNIPQIDTSNVTNMNFTFAGCTNLQTIPLIDTSNVTNMRRMLYNCSNLLTIPQLNTSNVTNMEEMFAGCWNLHTIPLIDTSNVTNMINMFSHCTNLETIPLIDTSNVTNISGMFYECQSLTSLPALNAQSLTMELYTTVSGIFGGIDLTNLTDFGGFLNLKCSLTGDNNLNRLPNLTYQSCINILNGLYDFTGNGETPSSEQGKLKVHPNFLTTVGGEISIGRNKGWTITAE